MLLRTVTPRVALAGAIAFTCILGSGASARASAGPGASGGGETTGAAAAQAAPLNFASCHQNAYGVQGAYKEQSIGFYDGTGQWISGRLIVWLEYCTNAQSNFARVFWYPDDGVTPFVYGMMVVNRAAGPDGGADSRANIHVIDPYSYQDSAVIYSPHNQAQACAYLLYTSPELPLCTPYR